MLQTLQIENYALIRSLEISFDKEFTVITGETGAGKSILMGALSLILGNRADTDILYDKDRKCIVEGSFDISAYGLQDFFNEHDLDYQNITTIRREINEHGKSRAFINDTPVNLNTLKTFASQLIDVHSQHQNLLLQDSAFRLNVIDQYAQNQDLRHQYAVALTEWKNAEKRFEELKKKCTEAALQQEFNQYTIQELESAQLRADEQEETERDIQILSHAENIKAHLFQASQQLSENEHDNILQQLKSVLHECAAVKDISPVFQDIHDRLDSAFLELKDIAYEIVNKEQSVDINPQELERMNERLDLIYSLQHKYQASTVQDLLNLLDKLREDIAQHTDNQEQLTQLDTQRKALQEEAKRLADQLTESRAKILPKLQHEVERCMQQLALPDSTFVIHLVQNDVMREQGLDVAEFLFSANRGIAPSDISKVASGGEMSRVMLAIKSVITDSIVLPTVIFDEIDTGISGETASRVANVLGDFSQRHQVVVITHLPQIAAYGRRHYQVYKENVDNRAVTRLKSLTDSERVQAIATLICGNKPTEAALNTAQELLSAHSQTGS